jgi:hypothetical protein
MSYVIDKGMEWDGIYKYTTDSGISYMVKIHETAPGSGYWTIDFIKLSKDSGNVREVFSIMSMLMELSMGYADIRNIQNVIIFISGENREQINQKTRIFTRWIKDYWNYQIVSNPEVIIPGKRDGRITIPTNGIFMTRKQGLVTPIETTTLSSVEIKFCYNCGTENNNFKFCPKCGTSLQQE